MSALMVELVLEQVAKLRVEPKVALLAMTGRRRSSQSVQQGPTVLKTSFISKSHTQP